VALELQGGGVKTGVSADTSFDANDIAGVYAVAESAKFPA
jgi:hypothetical protein